MLTILKTFAVLTLALAVSTPSAFANENTEQVKQLEQILATKENQIKIKRSEVEQLKIELALTKREVEDAKSAKRSAKIIGISLIVVGAGMTAYGAKAANSFWNETGGDITGPMMPFIRVGAIGVAGAGVAITGGGVYKLYVSGNKLDQVTTLLEAADQKAKEQEVELLQQESEIENLRNTIKLLLK